LAYAGGNGVIDMELLSVIRRWRSRDHSGELPVSRARARETGGVPCPGGWGRSERPAGAQMSSRSVQPGNVRPNRSRAAFSSNFFALS
jgi:hypothetical protein